MRSALALCAGIAKLGIYNSALEYKWMHTKNGDISLPKSLFWGAGGGMIGAYLSSPFYMVKTQLQSMAAKQIAVGYQHKHTSMTSALINVYKTNGIQGLWRGADSTLPRAALGSGAQMATFGVTKEFLRSKDIIVNPIANSFAAGAIAGSVMSLAITPPDVITTRMLNQGVDGNGRGLLYKSTLDCFLKVVRVEGLLSLYKGFWPNYMRIGPHSTLVLLFFDELLYFRNKYFD
ncbi:SLC25A34 family protein [Megaselia abdita]